MSKNRQILLCGGLMKHLFQNWTDSINIIKEQNINFPLHLHKTVELVLVAKGRVLLNLDGRDMILKEGDLSVIFPGQIHSYKSEDANSLLKIIIFNPFILKDFSKDFEHLHPQNPIIISENIDSIIYTAFDRLHNSKIPDDISVMTAWINLIIALIIKDLNLIKNSDIGEFDLLYKIIEYLSYNYKNPLSLGILARELHVNKYYLSHTFSNKLNMSFTEYLNRIRTDHAMQLLSSTDDSIEEIGYLSGFETQRTFNRVFKQNTGFTPKKYRSNN